MQKGGEQAPEHMYMVLLIGRLPSRDACGVPLSQMQAQDRGGKGPHSPAGAAWLAPRSTGRPALACRSGGHLSARQDFPEKSPHWHKCEGRCASGTGSISLGQVALGGYALRSVTP